MSLPLLNRKENAQASLYADRQASLAIKKQVILCEKYKKIISGKVKLLSYTGIFLPMPQKLWSFAPDEFL